MPDTRIDESTIASPPFSIQFIFGVVIDKIDLAQSGREFGVAGF